MTEDEFSDVTALTRLCAADNILRDSFPHNAEKVTQHVREAVTLLGAAIAILERKVEKAIK